MLGFRMIYVLQFVTRLQISCSARWKVHRSSEMLLFHLMAVLCIFDFHVVMIHV
jgi:hypothetical protein